MFRSAALFLFLAAVPAPIAIVPTVITPTVSTSAVTNDPDDPAIWVNEANPSRSLILGTNKSPAPSGALVVYGLDGKQRQVIGGLDRPNNVDVEYGMRLGGKLVDIAVLTERLQRRLRIFRIDGDRGELVEAGSVDVFNGQPGEAGAPMGIALYRRPKDGVVFAIVGRKTGPRTGYLWQYRLEADGNDSVRGVKVREFGHFSGADEIEAIVVDDALGYVYYADESDGIHKWWADPDHPESGRELARFGMDGFKANREGLAIYSHPDGTGFIVCTDQLPGSSEYRFYRRLGEPGRPHDHSRLVKIVKGGADSTDGLEASSRPLGPLFPRGLLVAMNSAGKNFLVYKWEDVAGKGIPKLPLW